MGKQSKPPNICSRAYIQRVFTLLNMESGLVVVLYATCMIAMMATSAKKFRAVDDELDGAEGGGGAEMGGAEQCERVFIF